MGSGPTEPEVICQPRELGCRDRPAPFPRSSRDEPAFNIQIPNAPEGDIPTARGALEIIALVVAPTTLVTALALYFGWVLTNSRASYFGLDASALGFSAQDYLLRSADALFVPLGTLIVLALGAVWLHAQTMRQLAGHHQRLRLAARVAAVSGGVLFVLGVVSVFRPLSFSPHYLFPSASPGIGVALLAYAMYLLDRLDVVEHSARLAPAMDARSPAVAVALIALLIVLSSFWTASSYAQALGRGRAARLAAGLSERPHVAVFAPKRLYIRAAGVVEQRLTGDDRAYRYRYSGLRLLIRSGRKYFLLPDGWTHANGAAIVLADSQDYRFEFGGKG